MTLMENKYTFVSFRKYTVHLFFPFVCVIKMTNDTHLRTQDIFALSLKHAPMYSILYKHAVSTWTMYIGKTTHQWVAWLLPCCLFFSVASSTEEKDYVRWKTEKLNMVYVGYKKINKALQFPTEKDTKAFIKFPECCGTVYIWFTLTLHFFFCTQSTGSFCCWCRQHWFELITRPASRCTWAQIPDVYQDLN